MIILTGPLMPLGSAGIVNSTSVSEFTVKPTGTLDNSTPLVLERLVPVPVTKVAIGPSLGLRELIVGSKPRCP